MLIGQSISGDHHLSCWLWMARWRNDYRSKSEEGVEEVDVDRASGGKHLSVGLRGWREASSHKTSHPPASPVLLTHTWDSHTEISVNVHIGFRLINRPCLVTSTTGLFRCMQDRAWALQGSQAKKTEKNGMNKHGRRQWQKVFCVWLGGGLH